MRFILETEGIRADDATVAIVASEAAGSMRDALTLLDQIVAFGGAELVGEEVARTLGIAGREALYRVVETALDGDGSGVLSELAKLRDMGVDTGHLSRQIVQLVRDLVVLRVADGAEDLVDLVAEERARAEAVSDRVSVLELQRVFTSISRVVDDVASSSQPFAVLEMGLVRVATRPPLEEVGTLMARLVALEKRLASGGGGGGGGPRGGEGRGGRRGGERGERDRGRRMESPAHAAPSAPPEASLERQESHEGQEGQESQESQERQERREGQGRRERQEGQERRQPQEGPMRPERPRDEAPREDPSLPEPPPEYLRVAEEAERAMRSEEAIGRDAPGDREAPAHHAEPRPPETDTARRALRFSARRRVGVRRAGRRRRRARRRGDGRPG